MAAFPFLPVPDALASGGDVPEITRKSSGRSLSVVAKGLRALDGKVAKAGWFETSHYEDGTPVALVAATQEYGAHINHPGGTPYRIGADGKAIFVSKAAGAGLPLTKAHAIIIPPRPFMRPTILREKQSWLEILASGSRSVMAGRTTAESVMEAIGARGAGDIRKSITQVWNPPLKASTIAARRRSLTDKKTVGALDKPLVASGIMLSTVTHRTGNE